MSDSSPPLPDERFLARAVEVSVRIGVVLLLAAWCFQITRPFLIPIVWGIILATAIHPGYQHLQAAWGGRRKRAAGLLTLLALSLLIVPTVLFAGDPGRAIRTDILHFRARVLATRDACGPARRMHGAPRLASPDQARRKTRLHAPENARRVPYSEPDIETVSVPQPPEVRGARGSRYCGKPLEVSHLRLTYS